jgi:UDP-N-acetyl-D-mannosaminuronic acid dehydrogenase
MTKNNVHHSILSEFDHLCISLDQSIHEALRVIDNGEERICFVIDEAKKLHKVITDGDIRRALLQGAKMDSPAKDTHTLQPMIVKEGQSFEEVRGYLNKRITILPVVDNKMVLVGYLRQQDVINFLNIKSREIAIIGLGYVGLTLSLVLADNGFSVWGLDKDENIISALKEKRATFFEKGLQNYLDTHIGHNLRLASSIDNIHADIFIITVGTPIIKKSMEPNIEYIKDAARTVAKVLKKNDLIVLRSTVPIGCSRNDVLPLLEKGSGLKVGKDFFLAFCPERTAEGRALDELRKLPQIVGGYCQKSIELAIRMFNENTHTVIDIGSLEAAEMCKLLDNTFRDTVFGYANQMAILAEKVGVDIHELIDKVNLGYNRNAIPKPSPGVGGPCLSKDPYLLDSSFKQYGIRANVSLAARGINEMTITNIVSKSEDLLKSIGKNLADCKVFVLGFAFKGEPETSDLRDSTTLNFIEELRKNKVSNIFGYDAKITNDEILNLGIKQANIEEGFRDSDAIFIMNNHRSFSNLRIFELTASMNQPALFFDGWHIFRPSDIRSIPGIIYAGVGVG